MKEIKQPNPDIQELLDAVLSEEPTEVVFNGKKMKIGWLHNGTIRKFSHIMVKYGESEKRNAKLMACVLLNSWVKIKLFYWLYWRWLYYIRDIDDVEVLHVLNEVKKKIQYAPFSLTTILAIEMMDTMMTMRRKEVPKATQAARHGEQRTP